MIRKMMLAACSLALLSTPAFAVSCRDAKGKFIKRATAASAKAVGIESANGEFAKRGTPGATAS